MDSDVLEDDDKSKLRDVEKRLFKATRAESCKDYNGEWTGSLDQNKKADLVIATKIRSAFRIHEKSTSNDAKEEFFYFK